MAEINGHGMGALDPNLPSLIDMARQDAQKRTGIDAAKWTVAKAEGTVWPSTALGLPRAGLEVMTPGYELLLINGSKTLWYHTSRSDIAFAGDGMDGLDKELG